MVRALRAHATLTNGWRLITPLLAILLTLSSAAFAPGPVAAGSSSEVASLRARLVRTEATMKRADKQIKRLKAQRSRHAKRLDAAKRELKKAIAKRDKVRRKAERATRRSDAAQALLGRTLRVHPNPKGAQIVDRPKLRKQVKRLKQQERRAAKRLARRSGAVDRTRATKQARLRKIGPARIAARRIARGRAERKLSGFITQMRSLSKERSGSRLAASSVQGFKKPARGRLTQRYGCTGYVGNPRRGSCRHFHDGVDLAAPSGTKVRASADGHVAYVGRNPWDAGRRAYIVIIGHARGYETIYAHLKPKRTVRAGERVRRGQVIGAIGMSGHTSGPHLHWEVIRDGRHVRPSSAGR